MKNEPENLHVPNPKGTPEERQLRRYIAIAMLFSPTLCVLPILAFIARGSRIAPIIWGIWIIIALILLTVIWQAAQKLRRIAFERQQARLHDEA